MSPAKENTNRKPRAQTTRQNRHRTSGEYPEHDSPCPSSHAPPVSRDPTLIPTATFSTPLTYAQIASADLAPPLPPLASTLDSPTQAQAPTFTNPRSTHQRQPTQRLTLKRSASKPATPANPPKNTPRALRAMLSNPANSAVPWKDTKRPKHHPNGSDLSSLAQWELDEMEDVRQNVVLRVESLPPPIRTNLASWKGQKPIEEMTLDEAIELDKKQRRDAQRHIIPAVPRLPFEKVYLKDDRSTSPILGEVKNYRSVPGMKNSYRPASPTLQTVRKLRANEVSRTSKLPVRTKQQSQQSRRPIKLADVPSESELEEINGGLPDELDIKQFNRKRLRTDDNEKIAACEKELDIKPAKEHPESAKSSKDLTSALRDISVFQGLSRPPSKAEERSSIQADNRLAAPQENNDKKSIIAYASSSEGLVTLLAKPGSEDATESQKSSPQDDDFEFVEVPNGDRSEMEVDGKQKQGWGWFGGRK